MPEGAGGTGQGHGPQRPDRPGPKTRNHFKLPLSNFCTYCVGLVPEPASQDEEDAEEGAAGRQGRQGHGRGREEVERQGRGAE